MVLAVVAPAIAIPTQVYAGDAAPRVIHQEPIPVPAEACRSQHGACIINLHFVIVTSGKTANIQIEKSSGYRECDMTALQTISKRAYAPVKAPLDMSESVSPYSCPGKPAAAARAIPVSR